MDDIVKRLRGPIKHPQECVIQRQEAADLIEEQAAEIEQLTGIIQRAAPVSWVMLRDIDGALAWEADASKAVGDTPKGE